MQAFLQRLAEMGIQPAEVITDGSSLYPETIARVWPRAVHQLCLFHETRRVVLAALKVIRAVHQQLPKPPPPPPKRTGRLRESYDPEKQTAMDRSVRIALVLKLREMG